VRTLPVLTPFRRLANPLLLPTPLPSTTSLSLLDTLPLDTLLSVDPLRPDSALDKVEADLKGVKSLASDASVSEFLANPILSSADKASGIESLLKKSSPKGASDLTKNFFTVLSENGRLHETNKAITNFLEIMSAHRGEVKVTITTAEPLEKDLQKRLETALKSSQVAAGGKSLIIENKIDSNVLGGLIVDFGEKSVDLSVASRVARLNAQLQGTSPFLRFFLHFLYLDVQSGREHRLEVLERW
jgi:F-type H+-transporting ATPase subunit O